jgi:hypothetical protein
MKTSLAALFLFFSVPIFAQLRVTERFQNISTLEQAQQFINDNPQLKPALLNLSAVKDTSLLDKRLLRQKKGDVFSVGYVTYKVLESADTTDYRAHYIFLDGSTYSRPQVDSIQNLIVQKASAGTSFETQSGQYKTHGDTDWFAGEYSFPKEFLEAVQKHKLGDIFLVEVPDRQWYYIVKKTYNDRVKKHMTILRSVGR